MTTNTDILYAPINCWNRTQAQTTMDNVIILTVSVLVYVSCYAYGWGDVICLTSLLGIYGSLYKLCDIASTPPAPAVVEDDEDDDEDYEDDDDEDDTGCDADYKDMPPLIDMNEAHVLQQLHQVVNETNARNRQRLEEQRLQQETTNTKIKAALTDLQQMIDNARAQSAAALDELSDYEDDTDFTTMKEE